jgi:xanthine/uracil permease
LLNLIFRIGTYFLRYVDEPIPLFLAAIMGLQHAFAMVGGLITVPFVIFKFTICFSCVDLQQYAIAAALITSGICTWINISKIPIPYTEKLMGRQMYIGTGILSVMGTSFTFLPIYEIAIQQQIDDGVEGTVAYGRMLGTSMLCGLLELFFSFMPLHWITLLFPPLVTSITVMLIGIALVGTGMKYWGGGAVCAEMIWKEHDQVVDQNLIFPPPFPQCANGDVSLSYGAPQLIGLGFSVLVALVLIELFGSVFMKYVVYVLNCIA